MKKLIIIILIIVIGAGIIAGFFALFSKPDKLTEKQKEKAISEILGRKPNLNPDIKTGDTSFNGKYAQFNYPASAEVYEYKDTEIRNNDSQMESFSFDLENPRRILNYEANKSNVSSLDEVSAVSYRKNKANGYEEKEELVDGISGLAFSKEGSGEFLSEKSVFFLADGNVISISITGSSLRDVEELYKQIIKSINFN